MAHPKDTTVPVSLGAEERFRHLVEHVNDYAIFTLDPLGHVVSWNLGAERINGYRREEILGQPFSVFYPPEDVASGKPVQVLETAMSCGRAEDEGIRIRRDGTRFWASVVVTAVRDEQGVLQGFTKVARDITERKQAEAALRQSEERCRLLVSGVRDYAIFMLDPEGSVVSWNEGATEIQGYEAAEVIGKHFSMFYPPDAVARGRPTEELRRVRREGRSIVEGWRVRKDGTRYFANVVITPMRDPLGTLLGFTEVTRDITEQRRQSLVADVSAALMATLDPRAAVQAVTRVLVPSFAEGCVVHLVDDDGQLECVASAHERHGQVEDVDGVPEALKLERTQQFDALDDCRAQLVTAEDELEQIGIRMADAQHGALVGTLGASRAVVAPLLARGRTLGLVTFYTQDPARTFDARDLELVEELARRMAMGVDNGQLYERSQEALHARDEFLSIASHELKTPLTPLRIHLQGIHRNLRKPGSTAQSQEALIQKIDIALRQEKRLSRLVTELLDISRIRLGRLQLDVVRMELNSSVQNVLDELGPELVQAGVRCRLTGSGGIWGEWDRTRIEQVVSNLVRNAAKYGGGGEIEIAVRADHGSASLSVSDHGIGIAEQDQARIFERFERAASRNFGGLGLGLYIARQIADAHHGRLSVRSALGKGSTFTLELPQQAHRATDDERRQSSAERAEREHDKAQQRH